MKKLSAVLILLMAIQAHAIKAGSNNAATVGGIAPSNIVTTNTNQTIAANKTVTSSFTVTGNVQMTGTLKGMTQINVPAGTNPAVIMGADNATSVLDIGGSRVIMGYDATGNAAGVLQSSKVIKIIPASGDSFGRGATISTFTATGLELHGDLALTGGATVQGLINVIGTLLTNGQVPLAGQSLKMFTSSMSWGN